jgi:hypothetical protein
MNAELPVADLLVEGRDALKLWLKFGSFGIDEGYDMLVFQLGLLPHG